MLWLNAFNLPEQEACLANQQMSLDAWCTTLKQVLYLFPFCEVNPPLQVLGKLRRSENNFTVLASTPTLVLGSAVNCPGVLSFSPTFFALLSPLPSRKDAIQRSKTVKMALYAKKSLLSFVPRDLSGLL
jgi:hypothetical protein